MSKTKNKKSEKATPVTIIMVCVAYKLLGKAKINQLDGKGITTILHTKGLLEPVVEAYGKFEEACAKECTPENIAELNEQRARYDELSGDEKLALDKVINSSNQRLNECLFDEQGKEANLPDYDRLSEDAFVKLIQTNPDWTLGEISLLQRVIA